MVVMVTSSLRHFHEALVRPQTTHYSLDPTFPPIAHHALASYSSIWLWYTVPPTTTSLAVDKIVLKCCFGWIQTHTLKVKRFNGKGTLRCSRIRALFCMQCK